HPGKNTTAARIAPAQRHARSTIDPIIPGRDNSWINSGDEVRSTMKTPAEANHPDDFLTNHRDTHIFPTKSLDNTFLRLQCWLWSEKLSTCCEHSGERR